MKTINLKEYLSNEELKYRYENAIDKEIRKRWHFLWLVQAKNYNSKQASIAVGHSKNWGQYWVNRYNEKGPSVIVIPKLRNPKWAQKKVIDQMKMDLLDRLQTRPPDEIGGGLWSGPKVVLFLKHFYNVSICRTKGWLLLKECGYSITTIRPTHRKSSKEIQNFFKI